MSMQLFNTQSTRIVFLLNEYLQNNDLSIIIIGFSDPFCHCLNMYDKINVMKDFVSTHNDNSVITDFRNLYSMECKDMIQGQIINQDSGSKFINPSFVFDLPESSTLRLLGFTRIHEFPVSYVLNDCLFYDVLTFEEHKHQLGKFLKLCIHNMMDFVEEGYRIMDTEIMLSDQDITVSACDQVQLATMIHNILAGFCKNREDEKGFYKPINKLIKYIKKVDPTCTWLSEDIYG